MKKLCVIWLIASLFVFPCIFDLENITCVIAVMASLILSVVINKRVNPKLFL